MGIEVDLTGMEEGLDWTRAQAEANRCLLCHDAPCSRGCPAGTDPATFIRKLRLRNVTGAIRTIKRNNVLGGVCGVLCPTARLCERECAAATLDRPIRIGRLQRFLVEHGWATGFQPLAAPAAQRGPVAVVGAGPAGLTCAAELALQGYRAVVLEARSRPGGVLAFGVPPYRLAPEMLAREVEDVRRLGVEIRCDTPVTDAGAAEALLAEGYRAVFLGLGCWGPVELGAGRPPGRLTSLDFLAALREGRSEEMRSAVGGRVVAVIGGGSVAMDCAGAAVRLGARDVYLVYRRSYVEMPAEEHERQEILARGVHLLLLNQPVGYVAGGDGAVRGLRLARTRLGEPDASGRRQPVAVPDSEWVLEADVVIEALGYQPAAGAAAAYPRVALGRGELVTVDHETCMTSVPGIFAGGDLARGPALVVHAVRDGKTAARAIHAYLSREDAP